MLFHSVYDKIKVIFLKNGKGEKMENNNTKSLMKLCKENTIIVREGEVYTEMYKLLSGKVAVYLHYGEDNEYLVNTISDQRCIGEISLLTKNPSPYTIVALTDVMLMRITADQFEDFIINNTKNAMDILNNMASSIVSLNKNIDNVIEDLSKAMEELSSEKSGAVTAADIRERVNRYKQDRLISDIVL